MVAASIHPSEGLGQGASAVFDFMTPSSHGCFMMLVVKSLLVERYFWVQRVRFSAGKNDPRNHTRFHEERLALLSVI